MRRGPSALVLVAVLIAALFAVSDHVAAAESVQLVSAPSVSPDGKTIAFSWRGDIYTAATSGGTVRQLTLNPARDGEPEFSPDGKQIAFTSLRTGSNQLFVMNVDGSNIRQLTFHTEGCSLQQWNPDGEGFLISAQRDHFWRHAERFFSIAAKPRPTEKVLFDAYGSNGQWSPDGKRLLFTREGTRWWRKGYRGTQASQVWMYTQDSKTFTKVVEHPSGCRYPLWHPSGKSFYYVSGESGAFNLWLRDLKTGKQQQLTHYEDDSIVSPAISANGSTIVFRHLFDLYRLKPGQKPQRIALTRQGDSAVQEKLPRSLTSATSLACSKDGLELAFIAGGDVWVMDTVLREPRQVTYTPEEERYVEFAPDGSAILFVSDAGGQTDIWSATRADAKKYWWQNESFALKKLTNDAEVELGLHVSPAGGAVAFLKERGDLWIMGLDGSKPKRLLKSWNYPDFDWSPDGKWMVYAVSDNEFNRDVFVMPIDVSRPPFNLSRHPDNDYGPVWSPDGKMIAFTGRRVGDETDIYYVPLRAKDHETTSRDRRVKMALDKMKKARRAKSSKSSKSRTGSIVRQTAGKKPKVTIDFEGIHDRVRRVSIVNTSETSLIWSPDSKRLAFTATVGGKRGTYTISPPLSLAARPLTTTVGSSARWLAAGNQLVWLVGGVPTVVGSTGSSSSYAFTARQEVDVVARFQAAFDQCWRVMRDQWYDGNHNNRNWDEIRRKYRDQAGKCLDNESFTRVVNLMLGELNGSHLGIRTRTIVTRPAWTNTTAHLGLRFVEDFKGPGLRVRDVIAGGPTATQTHRVQAGETVLSIDGKTVDPGMDLTAILNGRPDRDVVLKVRNQQGNDRTVTVRPISYGVARARLYEAWVRHNRAMVDKASKGKLAYLHIRGMNMTSFYRFERELYEVAAGKDGIVIDVRENGGGSTTDHLLTILTQPRHAITVPRGGGRGYPHDRKVYASWHKPIVVMCNQNSFSNAEIFSHAVKTLKRGQVVGVPSAGGVISTGSARIMDFAILRRPFRGWFLMDGQDMELNGAVPHHIIWPAPGEWPSGKDRQLDKAVEVLAASVAEWSRRPRPDLRRASERRKK